MRAPWNLDSILLPWRSLLPWSQKVSTQPKFSIWTIRETLRDDSQLRIGDTKKYILIRERIWCHEILIACYTTVLFLSNFFDLSSTAFEICLFLCFSVWKLTLVVLSLSFKIEKFLHQMAISCSDLSSWTEKSCFPCKMTWLAPQLVIICSDSWIFCLFISSSLSLFHSPRHDSRRRSLLMLVLSHSDTHHLNRYMA